MVFAESSICLDEKSNKKDSWVIIVINFFFCLDTKETKDQASIFLSQKSSDKFLYRDPSRSCFTLDSGAAPFCQR